MRTNAIRLSVRLVRSLVAIASVALGILGLTYGEFAPLGQVIPAGNAWLVGSAWLLLLAGALCFLPTAWPSVLIIGGYELAWALLSLPQIRANPMSIGSWYGFCEAMSSLVAPTILYVADQLPALNNSTPPSAGRARTAARILTAARIMFGLTCVFYGASHFVYADYTASMVPRWLPGPWTLAYFTGLAHVAAGVCLVVGFVPCLAATLEAVMMTAFGLLVWVPSFFMQPRPKWATPPGNQWSELVVNLLLATSAWLIVASLRTRTRAVSPAAAN